MPEKNYTQYTRCLSCKQFTAIVGEVWCEPCQADFHSAILRSKARGMQIVTLTEANPFTALGRMEIEKQYPCSNC